MRNYMNNQTNSKTMFVTELCPSLYVHLHLCNISHIYI